MRPSAGSAPPERGKIGDEEEGRGCVVSGTLNMRTRGASSVRSWPLEYLYPITTPLMRLACASVAISTYP